MYNIPKFKIGETIEANWAGGHVTRHVITGIKNTNHGFWYTWEDSNNGSGSGLHEEYLNKYTNK
jgi:hypothetical protein